MLKIGRVLLIISLGLAGSSCSLLVPGPILALLPGQMVELPATLASKSYWQLSGPQGKIAVLPVLDSDQTWAVDWANTPSNGTWLMAELCTNSGAIYARLGLVISPKDLSDHNSAPISKVFDIPGGKATQILALADAVVPGHDRSWNAVRLYDEIKKRLGDQAWRLSPAPLALALAEDRFRADLLSLPAPAASYVALAHNWPPYAPNCWQSLDNLYAPLEAAETLPCPVGIWNYLDTRTGAILVVQVASDGEVSWF